MCTTVHDVEKAMWNGVAMENITSIYYLYHFYPLSAVFGRVGGVHTLDLVASHSRVTHRQTTMHTHILICLYCCVHSSTASELFVSLSQVQAGMIQ